MLDDLPFGRGDRVLAFVNGMGGTPLMELYIVYGELHRLLQERGIAIARNLVGSYMTVLDMAGCSITLLRLDDELTALWDAPVDTPACGGARDGAAGAPRGAGSGGCWPGCRPSPRPWPPERDYLTELDAAIGDADHGSNMDRGMQAVSWGPRKRPPAAAGAGRGPGGLL